MKNQERNGSYCISKTEYQEFNQVTWMNIIEQVHNGSVVCYKTQRIGGQQNTYNSHNNFLLKWKKRVLHGHSFDKQYLW